MLRSITERIKSLAILSTAVIWFSCSGSGEKQSGAELNPVAAPTLTETVKVQRGNLFSSISLPGELAPFQQVDLYAKVNSYVRTINVDVGSSVHVGQTLAVLEAPELNSQIAGAQSNLKAREAVYLASKATYDRLLETSKTPGTVSGNDLDQAAAKKNADQAQWESARASLRELEQTKAYLKITAPFAGVISARNVSPGAYVGPSGKGSEMPLFTLQQKTKLRLIVSVPETYTSSIGQRNSVTFSVKTLPNDSFTAQIVRMAGAIDSKLRSERIEMDVNNSAGKLLPGMVAEIKLLLPVSDSGFIVPKTSVVNSTERVFVVKVDQGRARWTDVKVGQSNEEKVVVYGNLHPQDQIVKKATDEIRNGSSLGTIKEVMAE